MGTVVVIAGRHAPDSACVRDPGWSALLRVVALRNLAPQEAVAFLDPKGCHGRRGRHC
ncbi:hypothetical protein [Streptomyces sp. NPDC006527]|uniref:hypothetical protein n=1 Tax=Streptomyces sp. NPDC006527 TaxID=3364749 RepID=UPI0036A1C94F